MIYNFLFPSKPDDTKTSLFLLGMRVVFGTLMMLHGLQKWNAFEQMSSGFPDPIGLGSSTSLVLAIFGELICSLAFILGFLYRLSLIPMIVTMAVAFFIVHGADPFVVKELAFIYLIVFLLMYFIGPGKYSLDSILKKLIKHKR